jgi:hypothetical protein
MPRYRAVILAILLAVVPTSLNAQTQFAVSAFGGVFLPASDVLTAIVFLPPGSVPGFPSFSGDVAATFRQKTAFDFGGRITVWPSQRIGIEAEAAYALSDLNASVLLPVVRDLGPPVVLGLEEGSIVSDANVFMGSINVVFALIRPPLEPLVVFISGGIGYVARGGDGYEGFENTGNIAGTWGFGLKYGVARGIWLRGDVRDYISSYKEGDFDSKIQNDFLVNAGLEFSFGG